MKRKVVVSLTLCLIASFLVSGMAFAEPTEKVEVCHNEGNGSYHLIKISREALSAHLDNGDGQPGYPVPGTEGSQYFDDNCNIVEAVTPPVEPAPKVEVCHLEGNGSYHLIIISENALSAHLAHGDVLPGASVSGTEGKKHLDEQCSIVDDTSPVVDPGDSNMTEEAGVESKGDSTGKEIYPGFGNLGEGSNRGDAAYQVKFMHNGRNMIRTKIVDSAGTHILLTYSDAAPICGWWDVVDILVLDRLSTAAIAFKNVMLDDFSLGNFGEYDVLATPGWSVANWTVTAFDFSHGFTIVGDLMVEGWTGNESNMLQLTVGCLP